MRGPPAFPRRAGARPQPSQEATARVYSHPAPYGGWNARGNLANMPFTDAIVMDNVFPGVQDVQLRQGYINWVTGFGADIRTLMTYSSGGTDKLFAATNAGIYDVTGSGTVGAAVKSATNAYWSYVNFSTTGGSYLIAANGVDAVVSYDGASWANPGITGATPSNLNYVTAHQKRLWFIEKNSMKLWYLPVESIAGAATVFPIGALFRRGGYIAAIGSWTVDTGAGLNDIFVIVTSNGEIAAYQGSDPASSTTWSLVGVFEVPKPLGARPLVDFGGDLLYLSKNGMIPISKLAQSATLDRSQQVSFKIDGAFLNAAETYGGNIGWQMAINKTHNMLIVNVPVSQDTLAHQFVMNTITQAWCRFTGWNATCWAVCGDSIYFAGGRVVAKALQGNSDNGAPIVGTVIQAYSSLGMRNQKNISLVRPNIGFSSTAQITMALNEDFKTFNGSSTYSYEAVSLSGIWDSSLWNSAIWDSGDAVLNPTWTQVPNNPGYMHSFQIQITTSKSAFIWTSTDFAYRPAGIL